VLSGLTNELRRTVSLSEHQVVEAVQALVDERVAAPEKAEFLTALAQKGETVEEIGIFARELRNRSVRPPLDPALAARDILDVCGTGGDRLNTFNISSTVALVAAAAGVPVAKHGNRAITSQCGSADVLEALQIPIDLPPDQAAASLRDHGFAFFFAPLYHPAFKHIAPARQLCAQRGQRTIFNYLGPLLNPTRPTVQLIGVPSAHLCELVARVLQSLGTRRAMVVSGKTDGGWLDELSILGDNMIAEFYQDHALAAGMASLDGLPIQTARLADLAGGDRATNAQLVRRLLEGDERGPKRDAVLLNTAAALFVANKAKSLLEGWELAADLIDSGKAYAKLVELARGGAHPPSSKNSVPAP
jgi:anthranilate phosphoribosyltransferase